MTRGDTRQPLPQAGSSCLQAGGHRCALMRALFVFRVWDALTDNYIPSLSEDWRDPNIEALNGNSSDTEVPLWGPLFSGLGKRWDPVRCTLGSSADIHSGGRKSLL